MAEIIRKRKRKRESLAIFELGASLTTLLVGYLLSSVPNFLSINSIVFIGALREINNSIIFATLLTLFFKTDNHNIAEASKHPAYIRPALIFTVNSLLIPLLSSIESPERWIKISIVLEILVLLAFNLYILYKIAKLALSEGKNKQE